MANVLTACCQHTVAAPVILAGRGLHSGRPVVLRILPAEAGAGLRFRRTDLPDGPLIAAVAGNVVETVRCTVLEGGGGARVSTVEHVLSALHGLGVDNALIELDGPEVPIADGSSAPFCDLLLSAGLAAQAEPRRYRRLARAVAVSNGRSCAVAIPSEHFAVSVTLVNDHRHPALSDQFYELVVEPGAYRQSVAAARTFGFLAEVEAMRSRGLIQGASMENAVVLSDTEVMTPLRYPDELVRHKTLDLIGDLALLGPFHAHIIGIRTSHTLNNMLARAMAGALV